MMQKMVLNPKLGSGIIIINSPCLGFAWMYSGSVSLSIHYLGNRIYSPCYLGSTCLPKVKSALPILSLHHLEDYFQHWRALPIIAMLLNDREGNFQTLKGIISRPVEEVCHHCSAFLSMRSTFSVFLAELSKFAEMLLFYTQQWIEHNEEIYCWKVDWFLNHFCLCFLD